jgi:hypothetical protein
MKTVPFELQLVAENYKLRAELSRLTAVSVKQSGFLAQAMKEKNDLKLVVARLTEEKFVLGQGLAELRDQIRLYRPEPKFAVGDVVIDILTVRRINRSKLSFDSSDRLCWFYAFEGRSDVWSQEALLKPLPFKGKGYLND